MPKTKGYEKLFYTVDGLQTSENGHGVHVHNLSLSLGFCDSDFADIVLFH